MSTSSHTTLRHSWLVPALAFALVLLTLFNILQARVISAQRELISLFSRDSNAYLSLLARERQKPPVNIPPDVSRSDSPNAQPAAKK